MATAKQLANLAKARAARKKKAGKKVAKKRAPKKSSFGYAVQVKLSNGRTGYLDHGKGLDTNKGMAAVVSKENAEKEAKNFFNSHKRQLQWVKVIKVKK